MNAHQLEGLLNEGESTSLDFKRDQYPLEGATDDQKSELVKDILAFANAWRRSDAYILIGVEEVKGGRSRPVGVSKHLEDAHLQQLVNAKTNRKIDFRYEAVSVDGASIAVIHIPIQQRPSYLNKSFGKLKEEAVYIRRGTSTDIAKPDEIARMGVEANVEQAPKLDLIARVVNSHGLAIILAIRNEEGAGSAKAPRLSVKLKGPFSEGMYGLDGNGNLGLPRRPQGFDSGYLTYGGDTGTIIPAGITHDVTLLEYRGRTDAVPERVDIEFELSAEGVAPSRKVLILKIA